MRSSSFKKKYDALMLDVDGTVIPYDYDALPSEKIAQAIKKAQEKLTVCFVTGRSLYYTKPILKKLSIHKGYAVLNNGAHVLDLTTKNILYEQNITSKEIEEIIGIFEKEKIPIHIKQDLYDENYYLDFYKKGESLKKASMVITKEIYTSEKIDRLMKKLSHLSEVNTYKTHHKKGYGINIQHVNATKLRGIEIILKELKIKSENIIGVGDSYNDFSLLMACGLKVAMGNAVPDLKAIADYIAPSVDDDGVANVIEKFVLSNH